MTREDKKYIENVIDNFVDFYKFDLHPYNKAYRILFNSGLHKEIIIDFLRRLNVPANVRLIKKKTKTSEKPDRTGYIDLNTTNSIPFFNSEFKKRRFTICVDHDRYAKFEFFITTLCHELAHLILYSTLNKYRECEIATDLFIMAFGLYEEVKLSSQYQHDCPGYISNEQISYAYEYIKKRELEIQQPKKKKTFFQKIFG